MKIFSVLVMILAVGLAGCGEDGVMSKDAAMKLVNTAVQKAGNMKDLLGKITDGASAAKMKDQLAQLVPAFLSAKSGFDKIPASVGKLIGDKFGGAAQLFGSVQEQAGTLLKNADVKSKIGDLLAKIAG